MDCAHTSWLSNKEYLQELQRKATQQRIPLSGSLALTHRCNLRCRHCYLGTAETHHGTPHPEMSTEQICSLLDEATEAGCLNLLITGGEPLLRRDFTVIYRHAKLNGLLVTVFTNGTLISDEVVRLFSDLPPYDVEITLYGATAPTYEKITQVKGSFERCVAGIQQLLEHNIQVKLKTILMTLNRHEFTAMENMAKEYGVNFRFDAALFPRLNGDRAPLGLRVLPKEAIAKEIRDEDKLRQWKEFFAKVADIPLSNKLYQCGTGLTIFHIDPYGKLQPCVLTTNYQYDLLQGDFLTGWREVIPRIREKKAGTANTCKDCEIWTLCGHCPAFFELETGAEDVCSDYLCAMGHYRSQAISALNV